MKTFDYEIVKNPEIFKENRMEPHSDHNYYSSLEECLSEEESSFKYSLNGFWKFSYAKNYDSSIKNFFDLNYDCKTWDVIRVPGHIQLEGYDVPQYVNIQYPWDGREEIDPGEIPTEFNPTASYVKYFTLPAHMEGKRVFISFQGVESVWLCGLTGFMWATVKTVLRLQSLN